MSLITYDPSLRSLAEKALSDWGDPEENKKGLIHYPGGHASLLNLALYGIDITNGELIGIIGMEKSRKTTFVVNIFASIMTAPTPIVKPRMAYLTLESGQPPERVRDLFVGMMATQRMMTLGTTTRMKRMPDGTDKEVSLLTLSPEFLKYNRRYTAQQGAIDYALAQISQWPIYIYGPHKEQGSTRKLDAIDRILTAEVEAGCKLVCLDHAQQVEVPSSSGNSMQQLAEVVGAFAGFIVSHGIAGILISQVSKGSVKDAHEGIDRIRAVGGKKLDEEANVVFVTRTPEDDSSKLIISMVASRRAAPFAVKQIINPASGLFIGPPVKHYDNS